MLPDIGVRQCFCHKNSRNTVKYGQIAGESDFSCVRALSALTGGHGTRIDAFRSLEIRNRRTAYLDRAMRGAGGFPGMPRPRYGFAGQIARIEDERRGG